MSEFDNGTQALEHLPDPRRQARRLACSLVLVALLFAPWLPSMATHIHGPIDWQGFRGASAIQAHELSGYLRRWPVEYAGADGPLALGLILLAVLGLARSKREHAFFVVLWIGVPLLFSFTVASSKLAAPRYSLFVLPVYLLAVGRGGLSVASALQRTLRRFAPITEHAQVMTTPLVILTFAALCAAPLRTYQLSRHVEDWHGASQYLADNLLPGDIILADGSGYAGIKDSPRVVMALSHYLPIHGAADTTVLEVERGLWADLSAVELGQGRVWGVLWHSGRIPLPRDVQGADIVTFPGVAIVSQAEPSSGDRLQDAASTLKTLLILMPRDAGCFDVHLALAEMCLTTWRLEDAQAELEQARATRPRHPRASRELRTALVDLQHAAQPQEGMRQRVRYSLGQDLALLGYEVHAPPTGSSQPVRVRLWWGTLSDVDRDYTAFVHLVDQDGRIVSQEDKLLERGDLPSSDWPPGSLVMQEYQLRPGPNTEPGDYLIKIGVYYWATGERLPVWDEQGRRQPEDAIVMSTAQ
jgi:hypothetical protein